MAKETPTLLEVIENAVDIALTEVNTAMPAEIIDYDSISNTATVKPGYKRTYSDGEIVDIANIEDVPLAFPRSGNAAITFPIKAGDKVLLIFSQRSMDNWKQFGSTTATDARKFNLSDAIAIPGVYPLAEPISVEPDKLAVRFLNSKILLSENGLIEIKGLLGLIKVDPAGKITIGNGTIDLLDLVDKLLDAIIKMTVGTALGPSSAPINLAEFQAIKTQLGLIKE